MKSLKKKIVLCLIFSIISLIANLITLIFDIIEQQSNLFVVLDWIYVVVGVAVTIYFIIYTIKPVEYILKRKKQFLIVCCVSCVCSLMLAIICLLVLFELNSYIERKIFNNEIEVEGTRIPTAEELTKELNELETKKKNNEISPEEYDIKKKDILDKLINGNS